MKTIGERLRESRIKADLSQNELAEKTGINSTAISRWENDRKKIGIDNIFILCKELDISADYLLGIKKYIGTNIDKGN